MTAFRWASGDLLYTALAEGREPLTAWEWAGVDPLRVYWLGDPAERRARGRILLRLVRAHFTVRSTGRYWILTRKEEAVS